MLCAAFPPNDDRELLLAGLLAGLYRFRMWQRGDAAAVAGIDDEELIRKPHHDGVWLAVTPLPTDLPPTDAAEWGWWSSLGELPTSQGAILLATMSSPVIEIAAASIRVRQPRALVAYATVFWAHTAVHN